MALTTDELRSLEAAKLESLISELMAARRADNDGKLDAALDNLVDFITRTPFQDLQNEARNARTAAAVSISKVALEELSRIADRATAAGAGFKAAAMIAESGKKELLFPSLAGAAARGLELLKQFQEAIDSVKATIDSVDELGDVPQALEDLVSSFETLKKSVREAGSSESIMESVPAPRAKKKVTKSRAKKKASRRKVTRKRTAKKKVRTKTRRKTKKKVKKVARKKAGKTVRKRTKKTAKKTGKKTAKKSARKTARKTTRRRSRKRKA